MEDLAPREPMRKDAQRYALAVAGAYVLVAALVASGWLPGGLGRAAASSILAAVALVATTRWITYAHRATAFVVLGSLACALGLRGVGPTIDLAPAGALWAVLRLVAATALPTALLFRARYRAYPRARHFLVVAVALAVPYASHAATRIVTSATWTGQLGAALALFGFLATLLGFMGKETTGAGSYTAGGLLLGMSLDLWLGRVLLDPNANPDPAAALGTLASAGAFALSAGAFAVGTFQLLAMRFGPEARTIDLHAAQPPPSDRPSAPSASEWSTRE